MKNLIPFAALATALSLSAQDGLLYTVKHDADTRANKPASLQVIDKEDVAAVVPNPVNPPSARKFAPHDAWCALVGDEDADNAFWESPLADQVDALLWCQGAGGRSMRELYISTSKRLQGNVNMSTGGIGTRTDARPADVFRVVIGPAGADGQFRFFLKEEQIRAAFQIATTDQIDVDAIAVDWSNGIVYLSLEDTHTVTVHNPGGPYTLVATDGAVLGLRVVAFGEPVTLGGPSAIMVLTESQVNAMVTASGIRRHDASLALNIDDLDGLEVTPGNGTFQNNWGTFHHLMFTGERLTGGGIVGTNNAIATINGAAMGSSAGATDGAHIGLRTVWAGSLDGLDLQSSSGIGAFVTETPTPELHGAGTVRVDVEGVGGGVAFLLLDVATLPIVSLNAAGGPISPSFFPETIWPTPLFITVPLNAQGIGSMVLPVPAMSAKVIFQAAQVVGPSFVLSTPSTVELYPM